MTTMKNRQMIRPIRISNRKLNQDKFFSGQNDFDDDDDDSDLKPYSQNENSKSFKDFRIKLSCYGECGSMLATLFVNETNVKNLKNDKTPRFIDVYYGKAPKRYYQKLVFTSHEKKQEFCDLFINRMKNIAKRTSMGAIPFLTVNEQFELSKCLQTDLLFFETLIAYGEI